MFPHNDPHHHQHHSPTDGMPSGAVSQSPPSFDPSHSGLNVDIAKQMAALNAANQIRMRSAGTPLNHGGISSGSFAGGSMADGAQASAQTQHNQPSMLDANMSQQRAAMPKNTRSAGFLRGLAGVMAARNTPLPPHLTGHNVGFYDPNTSQFNYLEIPEVGVLRLAGKDIELFRLWGLVISNGGGVNVTNNNGWTSIITNFELPEEVPEPFHTGTTSVPAMLQHLYMSILHPCEDMYRKNVIANQQKAASRQMPSSTPTRSASGAPPNVNMSQQQSKPGQFPSNTPPTPVPPQTPSLQPNAAAAKTSPTQIEPQSSASAPVSGEADPQSLKRKSDAEEDGKRTRQKTEPPDANSSESNTLGRTSSSTPSSSTKPTTTMTKRPMPQRRKIEYVPFAREVDSFGGRDFKALEAELAQHRRQQQQRDLNDWGVIDIDCLMMSVRSRISTELSYALTTLSLLSTMRGPTPGSGFPISQCEDLLGEVLDLLEDAAFDGADDTSQAPVNDGGIVTHRELITQIRQTEDGLPFAALNAKQGSKPPHLGPLQRPGNIVLVIMNILRNLAVISDNLDYLSRQSRMLDIVLRLCTLSSDASSLNAASKALSISDLVSVRKDALYLLSNIASAIHFPETSPPSKETQRIARRAFELTASYLVDPTEAVSPIQSVQTVGGPIDVHAKPSGLADIALDAFTRLSQSDANRHVLCQSVPQAWLWRLFSSLVHRLPQQDVDFQMMVREQWLSYQEKNIMALYSIAFLSPSQLKKKVKKDRELSFKNVMLRLVRRLLMHSSQLPHNQRTLFMICIRRAVETMKVVDDEEDPFESSASVAPTLSFGMGWNDAGEGSMEQGTGMLGANRDIAWELLMMKDVGGDEVIFSELESLARVE